MRLFTALKKNIVPILFVGVAAAILIYMTQRKEGFTTCNATNCRSRGGSWINNICYRPCSATGAGNVPYQSCIVPLSRAQYDEYERITDLRIRDSERENDVPREERIFNPSIARNTPCGGGMLGNENFNIRTDNTRCGSKLRPRENRPSRNIARPRFSSC